MDISVALIQGDPLLYHTSGCLSIGKINKIKNFLSIIFVTFSQNYRLGLFVQQYQNYKNFLTIFCNLCALTFFSLVFLNKKRPSSSGFFVQKVEKKCTKKEDGFCAIRPLDKVYKLLFSFTLLPRPPLLLQEKSKELFFQLS